MYDFLWKLLELSLMAGVLTIVILLIRLVFRKIPAKYLCVLWMIVAARLVIPFSFESSIAPMPGINSLFQEERKEQRSIVEYIVINSIPLEGGTKQHVMTGTDSNDETDYYISNQVAGPDSNTETENTIPGHVTNGGTKVITQTIYIHNWRESLKTLAPVLFALWMTGAAFLLGYGVFNCIKVKHMVKDAIHYEDNIWLCEGLESPFLFGWIHPEIYLPCDLEEEQMQYVIEHERAHLARGDNFSKLIGYLLLSVYWFNPLIWVAYRVFCKDVERACDEKVITGFDAENRKRYAEALLQCSLEHGFATLGPLAFGEMDVKKRIAGILSFKKPGKWLAIIAVLLCIAAMIVSFVVRKGNNEASPGEATPSVASPTPVLPTDTPTPTSVANVTATPLPPSDLELLGKTTSKSLTAVPVGQTITVDLDGDGVEESVTFGIKGYEGSVSYRELEDAHRYTWKKVDVLYFLQINDTVFPKDQIAEVAWDDLPGFTTYYIFDIDVTDGFREIGLYFDGPSGDPHVDLLRLIDGELYCVGSIGDAPLSSDYSWNSRDYKTMSYEEMVAQVEREGFQITVPGDGTILYNGRVNLLQTDWTVHECRLWYSSFGKLAVLKETMRERYEFTGWQDDNGKQNAKTAKDLVAYKERTDITGGQSDIATVTIPEGTRISFYAYYPDNGWTAGWVQFAYGEALDSFAWFYKGVDQSGRFLLYFPEETAGNTDDLFLNLNHAD